MIGFLPGDDKKSKIFLRLIRTKHNDRQRSRQTSRKGSGFDFNFVNKLTDDFAKEMGEFANKWCKEFNDKKFPSARQVVSGLI